MKVALCSGGMGLEQRLRLVLRLRWPDIEVVTIDAAHQVVEAAPSADVVFIAWDADRPGGLDLIRQVRAACESIIIYLTRQESEGEMLDVLEAGADDYLSVAFSPAKMVSRVSSLLRRVSLGAESERPLLRSGPIDIRPDTREVRIHGEELRLTPTEFNLLYRLALAQGSTVTCRAIQRLIWECDEPLYLGSLRKHVQRLRKKLYQLANSGVDIVAVRGVGYRLAYDDC